mmetsp:Transcript_42165/g.164828  ORF Transcript_42165/g.164828 Transcript_42165/m.164828 type:complete len:101 (+) Transcript_42165:1793-2095(+)
MSFHPRSVSRLSSTRALVFLFHQEGAEELRPILDFHFQWCSFNIVKSSNRFQRDMRDRQTTLLLCDPPCFTLVTALLWFAQDESEKVLAGARGRVHSVAI